MEVSKDTEVSKLARRAFLKRTNLIGMSAAAATLIGAKHLYGDSQKGVGGGKPIDTPSEIFTAALVAEDLATAFYYNGLIGGVIQDPNLAGPGGTANNPNPTDSNPGNVMYLQAALYQEIQHANLFRSLLGISSPASDPYQTFYFPAGTFDTLTPFISLLETLENAFIGAYTIAIFEFAQMAVAREYNSAVLHRPGTYTPSDLEYYGEVAASILGVESEHRVLGRVITSSNPANNLNYNLPTD